MWFTLSVYPVYIHAPGVGGQRANSQTRHVRPGGEFTFLPFSQNWEKGPGVEGENPAVYASPQVLTEFGISGAKTVNPP